MLKFENKQNGRFYYLIRNKDFFDDMVLTVIRGGNRSRIVRHYAYNDEHTITSEIHRLSRIRIKHGYELVT